MISTTTEPIIVDLGPKSAAEAARNLPDESLANCSCEKGERGMPGIGLVGPPGSCSDDQVKE